MGKCWLHHTLVSKCQKSCLSLKLVNVWVSSDISMNETAYYVTVSMSDRQCRLLLHQHLDRVTQMPKNTQLPGNRTGKGTKHSDQNTSWSQLCHYQFVKLVVTDENMGVLMVIRWYLVDLRLYLLSESFLVAQCILSPLLGLVCRKLSDNQGRRSMLISCSGRRQSEGWLGGVCMGGTKKHAVIALFWRRENSTNVNHALQIDLQCKEEELHPFWNAFWSCTLNLLSK